MINAVRVESADISLLSYGVSPFYGVSLSYDVSFVRVITRDGWYRGSHSLSAHRARRTKSRGPKGLKLEVGAWRASTLLVCT